MQDHRKLRVWRKAHDFAVDARRATREFPRAEYGSLKTQLVHAAESIVLNIAEGCGARSPRDFTRFLDIAVKSTIEVESQLELSRDHGALDTGRWTELSSTVIDIRRMLCGLRAVVLRPPAPRTPPPSTSENAERTTPNGIHETWIS